ncbi:MAG: hypothetical protein DKM50_07685 [Candidatus Margulisiibacteriota bacterium]|nr:MAG: hypothetical protein DKM50_07685 [Candidatus Margulisiibacteriota bacterium]HCY37753.1 hypothetical protein [Candidatus Margulisiibacteriota bacterium]
MLKVFEIATGYTSIPAKVGAATEIVVENLAQELVKSSIDVSIIDLHSNNRIKSDYNIHEIKVPEFLRKTTYTLGFMHKLKRIIYSFNLAMFLRSLKVNNGTKYILHFHNQYNYYFFEKLISRKIKRKSKTMYTLHSYIWSQDWDSIKSTVKKKYFLEIFALKHADRIIVLNEKAKQNIEEHIKIDKKKIVFIPNGVNSKKYCTLKNNEVVSKLIATYKPRQEKILFHVGSICPRKNQFNTIKLLAPFLSKHNFKFIYAGGIIDPEYFAEINNYVTEKNLDGKVVYLGEINPGKELNYYYNLADAFIFMSESEAFSLVVLEALSAGLPVFLKDTLFNATLDAQQNGIVLFNEENFQTNFTKTFFYDNTLKGLSNDALNFINKNLTWEKVARQHISLFTKV